MHVRVRWPFVLIALLAIASSARAQPAAGELTGSARVYVILWFDTEDYLLPASDDAALKLAEFLTDQGIRATFKVVGEKARTLERRERFDVLAALKKHEIGYHSNWHSVQPTPAMYLSDLGWDAGVAEFERREGAGRADVERILGQAPTCYGQPGSSWAPQSFGGLRNWRMGVYLDAGDHVKLDSRPHYYCGILTLYKLAHTLRTGLNGDHDLRAAEDRFEQARRVLHDEGGGVVSIYYHPCEFVHKEFWDGVNFRAGANPPREKWVLPPRKSPEESAVAWRTFESYIRFIRGFDDVRFVTASEAAKLYVDRARARSLSKAAVKMVAERVTIDVTFQRHPEFALAASEIFWLLNRYVATVVDKVDRPLLFDTTPLGPTEAGTSFPDELTVDWSQFARTTVDVADFVDRQGRVPSTVWLGSKPVSPESYLVALANVAATLVEGREPPESVTLKRARLAAADYVAEDDARLWGWVIFPPGFRAPAMMELAKRQAWTLKPALLATATKH
ncbi:MAG TPA: hypothetical protein VHC22_21555 [Pirellulales bacterium]|nr:hypothetical protein [Pirellulales bacterium]